MRPDHVRKENRPAGGSGVCLGRGWFRRARLRGLIVATAWLAVCALSRPLRSQEFQLLRSQVNGSGGLHVGGGIQLGGTAGQAGTALHTNGEFLLQAGFWGVTLSPSAQPPLPPLIIQQPQGQELFAGSPATFSVLASGSQPLHFRWLHDGFVIPDRTNATLIIPAAEPVQEGAYRVIVSNLAGSATSHVALLTLKRDFGDAPGFPTRAADNGARHLLRPGWHLGETVDSEPDGQPNPGATGDDLSGMDDEDGITCPTELRPGQMAPLVVTASTNGFLDAWVDFNGDGDWTDLGERIFTARMLHAGDNVVSFPVPLNAVLGEVFARFRFSDIGELAFFGEAPAGEVEDYRVTIAPAADLAVDVSSRPQPVVLGKELFYTIAVTNRGPHPATAVTLSNALPAGIEFLEATPSQGSCLQSGNAVICDLANVAPQASAQVEIVVRPVFPTPMTNVTFVRAAPSDPVETNNVAVTVTEVIPGAPFIRRQPEGVTNLVGADVSFRVEADGLQPLSYQWKHNGFNLPGATSPVLNLANIQPADAGFYSVRVGNAAGAVVSQSVPLDVWAPPVIVEQPPQTVRVPIGSTLALEVVAKGTPPLTFQWLTNGLPLLAETASSLRLDSIQPSQGGAYQVTVSNPAGAVTSAVAQVTVLGPPVILVQPAGTNVAPDQPVTFSVQATGSPTLKYQWRLNGINIPDATNATFTIINARLNDRGQYQVFVSNDAGLAVSQLAELIVDPGITLLAGVDNFADRFTSPAVLPGDDGTIAGDNTGFTSEENEPPHAGKPGGSSAWYSWTPTQDGIATFTTAGSSFDTLLAIYTNSTLTPTMRGAEDDDRGPGRTSLVEFNALAGTNYAIAIDGFVGPTGIAQTGRFLLTWTNEVTTNKLPVVITHPSRLTLPTGSDATFAVEATGTDLQYQWYFNGGPLSGATNHTLALSNIQSANVGQYRVELSNLLGRVVRSRPATLALGPAGYSDVYAVDKFDEVFFKPKPPPPAPAAGAFLVRPAAASSSSSDPIRVAAGLPFAQPWTLPTYDTFTEGALCCVDVPARDMSVNKFFQPERDGYLLFQTTGAAEGVMLSVFDGFRNCVGYCSDTGEVLIWAEGGQNYLPILSLHGTNVPWADLDVRLDLAVTNSLPETNVVLRQGADLVLTALATDTISAPTYQWLHNGEPIPGATNSTFLLSNVDPSLAGSYEVLLSNPVWSSVCPVADLVVESPLVFFLTLEQSELFLDAGPSSQAFVLQASSDLLVWDTIAESQAAYESHYLEYHEEEPGRYQSRFYRVILQPSP